MGARSAARGGRVFLAWVRYDRRTELLARHLGADVYFVRQGRQGQILRAPLRYAVAALRTWRLLRRARPSLVLVQNPPIVAVVVAALHAWVHGSRFAVDSHSAAFLSPKWRWSVPLHRRLSARALVTIVPNEHLEELVAAWGCRVFRLGFTPGDYPPGNPYPVGPGCSVAVISTPSEDEPLAEVFGAAAFLPDVSFYITGDSSRLPESFVNSRPQNCHFTGWIPYDDYVGLLRSVDLIADFTTRDHTVLMGGFEAVSLGKPFLTSNWPVLRATFPRGTVHTENEAVQIKAGLDEARRKLDVLSAEMASLRDELEAEWRQSLEDLAAILGPA